MTGNGHSSHLQRRPGFPPIKHRAIRDLPLPVPPREGVFCANLVNQKFYLRLLYRSEDKSITFVAIAAPEEAPRDSDAAPRPEQEAARQNAEKNPVQTPQQDTLARHTRATVEALLNLLRSRVLSALTDLGISEQIALKAANSATVQLAGVLAGESRHGAEIVHALLDQIQSGQSFQPTPSCGFHRPQRGKGSARSARSRRRAIGRACRHYRCRKYRHPARHPGSRAGVFRYCRTECLCKSLDGPAHLRA